MSTPAMPLCDAVARLASIDPDATNALLEHLGAALRPLPTDVPDVSEGTRLGRGEGVLMAAESFTERVVKRIGAVAAW